MKIAFYCPMKPINHPVPSGDRLIANHLYEFLKINGHEIFILSDLRTLFFHKRFIKYLLFYLPYHFFKAFLTVIKKRPDVFLSYHVKRSTPDYFGPLFGLMMRKSYYIFDGNYCISDPGKFNSSIACYATKYAFKRAAHVFQNKTNAYHALIRHIDVDRVSYIKPGINLDDFGEYSRSEIRKNYQVDDNVPIISSNAMCRAGRKADSIRFLIDCLESLKSKSIKFVWIHAGGDGEFQSLKEYAEDKLGSLAIMPGVIAKDEVHALMEASDIFTFPGIDETLGMVYLEAQYYQTPVVAFDNGGISEVVKNNITGFLVPPMDMDAYINAIEILLSNPEKRLAMGREARKSVIQDHDINKNYQKILDVLSQ